MRHDATPRNRGAELAWLLDVVDGTDVVHPEREAWINAVVARLDQGGPAIRPAPLHRLVREIDEELADAAAWGLVLLQAHPRAQIVRPTLREVATHAYAASASLARLTVEGR